MAPIKLKATIAIVGDGAELVERSATGSPTAFRIWRAGENPTDKGMTVFSARSAAVLVASQAARANLISIDVDHLSLSEKAPPESRKAVGWHRLEVRKDASGAPELWAVEVEWTDAVRAGLEKSPPEWRFFSPAYEVDPESREVVAYLNTALTNNPATWGVTALASRATADTATQKGNQQMEKLQDILAALKAIAAGDDEEAKKTAAAMIAAFEPEKKDDPAGDEAPKEEKKDAEEPKGEPDGDEPKDEKATVTASLVELASKVQELSSELLEIKKDKAEAERASLISSRSDIAPELMSVLKKAPLTIVRDLIKALPSSKKDLAASAKVQATRGAEQVDGGIAHLPPEEKRLLDERMGVVPVRSSIKREGNSITYGVLTADAAKELIAAKKEA